MVKHNFEQTFGSRAEVMHGKAMKTSGGLKKIDLVYNKQGRIVSKKKSMLEKKKKTLKKMGFDPKKGKFKLFKKSDRKKSKTMKKKN